MYLRSVSSVLFIGGSGDVVFYCYVVLQYVLLL